MTAVYYALGVVFFIVAILASIGLHELGHLIPAKAFGGKVTQYFIGFGPTVWSTQRGETEVGVKAIPLGGYVKIIGMLPPGADELGERQEDGSLKVRRSNTGMFTQLISDARAAEWELVEPGDEDRLFYKMTWWKKVVVMAGGPTVNLAIAFVLFSIIFGAYGMHETKAAAGRPVLAEVSQCVIPFVDQRTDCRPSDPESPAAKAGLRPGDTITSFNGTPVTSWDQLKTLVRANDNGTATIGYLRDGVDHTATTNTTVEAQPTSETDQTLKQVGFLGVTPHTRVVATKGGPLFTLEQMGGMTRDSVDALVHLPVKVWGVGEAIVGAKQRDPNGPVSIVGGGRIAGEAVADHGYPAVDKLMFLLGLVAGFNLFIGLFNFVPLLPLDGGHIASALWEAVRRGIARLGHRPDPGYVDAAKLLPVAYVVASALLVMGGVLIIGDLVVPVHLQS
jgi:membrane-associated protease RseP (regulator of RpoE activity)